MASKTYQDPRPDILRIEELVSSVKTGDIKLPKFQRPFVWNKDDILKLLDSVYSGYPIGSILLWLTNEKLASENKIGDLVINNKREEIYPINYLLDGQQRLSVLCGSLYWDGEDKNSNWNICFDLEKEEFLYPKGVYKLEYFPLNKLIDTEDFLNQCKTFESHKNKERYFSNARRLLNSIKDYKIAAVRIGDLNLKEVAPIFERINSSGRKLTMVDLMRAATWTEGGFDLNDAIKSIRYNCASKNFGSIKDLHILRSISACAGLGIHKEDIDKLRNHKSESLKEYADKSIESYKLAVDFLTTEFPINSIDYLPYGLQLTFLVEFFNLCPKPKPNQRAKLKSWFWATSFSRYFGTSNTGQMTKDLIQVRSFANEDIVKLNIDRAINYDMLFHGNFSLNKAASKTFALLLARKRPRSLIDGSSIDTHRALALINKLEFHHIFPRAYLRGKGYSDKDINQNANICMLNSSDNKEISSSGPIVYFKKMQEIFGERISEILESNFIDQDAYEAALEDNYPRFIKARTKMLREYADKMI